MNDNQKKSFVVSSKKLDPRPKHYDRPEIGEDGILHSRVSKDQNKDESIPHRVKW